MLAGQVSRASCRLSISSLPRLARVNTALQMRGFIAPTVSRRADFVQELYLKELKAYKPTPVSASDAEGNVKTFNLPKTPISPEETDLASSLREYETLNVDVAGAEAASSGTPPALPDWLEEEEVEAEGAHH